VLEFIDSQAKLYQIPPEAVALALESHPRNPDGLVKAKKNLQQITNDSRFSEAEEQKAANIVKILTDFLALPKEQQKAADTMMQTPGTRSQLIYRLRKKEYI
jgi:hypothetical protein